MDMEAIERSCKYLNQLFINTIENMKSGFTIWKDFTYKAAKLHVALRSICQAVAGFLDAFQKMADLATNAKGATKEIGVALTRLCLRHRNIEKKLDHVTHTFGSSLITPIEERLEEWKKIVFQIEKDHARDSKKALREYKKVALQAEKLEKKNKKDTNLQKEMSVLNTEKKEKLVAMETIEKSSVRCALLEERKRHCHVIQAIRPFVEAEMALLSDLMHLEEIMASLTKQSQDPHILPSSSEQVILDITSQVIPEGWSCQPSKSIPTPSESILSLSSVYSLSNRSSIASEYDAQSSITDINLNASLSSLPTSLTRNHRTAGSVPPSLDRGYRNGRPLFRQSLYNPALLSPGSHTSSTSGLTFLQQQQQMQQQRQKQLEHNSRLLFPSTSAPSTPEAKLQLEQQQGYSVQARSVINSSHQHRVAGKPPTFPPSYLRRKGSFGKALQPSHSGGSTYAPSPTASMSSFQSVQWIDSERPHSLAVGGLTSNQLPHSFSEHAVCGLAPPVSQSTSLSSSSTLKDDEEREEENDKNINLVNDRLNKISVRSENDRGRSVIPTRSTSATTHQQQQQQQQNVITSPLLPQASPASSCSTNYQTPNNLSNQLALQQQKNSSQSTTKYASPTALSPRNNLPFVQDQRSPHAMPTQKVIDGYKIQPDLVNKSMPSPQSVNYVDFHALPGSPGVSGQVSADKPLVATNQVFINLENNTPKQSTFFTGQVQSSQFKYASPIHPVSKPQPYIIRFDAKEPIVQVENEPRAYRIVPAKKSPSAAFEQHFQQKIITFPPQLQQQTAQNNIQISSVSYNQHPVQLNCATGQQCPQQAQGYQGRGSASPSTRRQLPPPPLPPNLDSFNERGHESQFCPWTLRARSPSIDRSNNATPTNEHDPSDGPDGPPQQTLAPTSPLRYPPIPIFDRGGGNNTEPPHSEAEQSLPKGFVKHWENTV